MQAIIKTLYIKENRPFMILKLVFKKDIYRCPEQPSDFTALLSLLVKIFGHRLPKTFTLRYVDVDGDRIVLSSDDDYQAFLNIGPRNAQASVKIFVQSADSDSRLGQISLVNSFVFDKHNDDNLEEEKIASESSAIIEGSPSAFKKSRIGFTRRKFGRQKIHKRIRDLAAGFKH